jgi:hypothetical protein
MARWWRCCRQYSSRNTIVIGGHIRSFTTHSIPEHFNQDIAVLMPAFCDVVLKAEETLQNAAVRGSKAQLVKSRRARL